MIFLSACNEDEKMIQPIQVCTNKGQYSADEKIIVEVINLSDSAALYFKCSSYQGIPPSVFELKNNNMTAYSIPVCDGYISHCCGLLPAGITYRDTLEIDFLPGHYIIEYSLIVHPGHEYESYFSNVFQIEQ